MLSDPTKLMGFLNSATKSISTDEDFSVGDMRKLAGGLKGMDAGGIRFVTVPFGDYAPDPNRISLDKVRAEPLFEAIRQDIKVPEPAPTPSTKVSTAQGATLSMVRAAPEPPAAPAAPVAHNLVKVRVYSGGGAPAAEVAGRLRAEKFEVIGTPGPPPDGTAGKTQILYGEGAAPQAATLAELVPGVKPASAGSVPAGVVYLVLGKDWKGLQGLTPTGDREIRADQNICQGA
jgi:hypothetical protein